MLKGIKKSQIAGMNLIYKWHTFEYFLDSMQELGFESISIWGGPPHFDCDCYGYQDCKKINKAVKERGLKVTGFLVTGSNYRYQIGVEEPDEIERTFEYFRNGILAAEELQSPYMTINSGWGYYDHDREEAFKRSADMIRRLCEEGQKHGVYIALESLKSLETQLVFTLEDTQRMEKEVDYPYFRIAADTGAITYAKEHLEDWFDAFGEKIIAMHFVDGMHKAWGDGNSPLDEMMAAILTHDYQGTLALETSGEEYFTDPREADRKALKVLSRFVV